MCMYVWSCGCVFTETDRHKTFSAYKKKLATKAYNLVFFFCFFFFLSKMERNVVVSRRRKSEPLDGFDFLPSDSEEAHVLAVDDSLVDRKVIEQLLKISSFKGLLFHPNVFSHSFYFWIFFLLLKKIV